jgi:hypothetical protein
LTGRVRLRAFASAALAAAFLVSLVPAAPSGPVASAASPTASSPAQRVVALARSRVGYRYAYGTTGPSTFDCSGLVIWAYRTAGYGSRVGNGSARSASAMYHWFLARGLASRTNPQLGDVIVWGGGSHVGIYVGNGMAVSALNPRQGIRLHGVNVLGAPFTAYLHTQMAGVTTAVRTAPRAAANSRHSVAWLNLRAGPGLGHTIITVLTPRTPIRVRGSRRDASGRIWLHVIAGSRRGWVAARYVSP